MPTKLRKLKITRVAVCRQGANFDPETGEGAHILLFKAQDEEEKRRSGVGATPQPDARDLEDEDEEEDEDEDEAEGSVGKAWSTAAVNDFPDASFAYISPGGSKDASGKTTPRSLRHLPYKDKGGKPDRDHVQNALARLNQTDIPAAAKASAGRKLRAAARALGMELSADTEKQALDYSPLTGWHSEPDADAATEPLDYATRSQQQELWSCLLDKWQRFSTTFYDCVGDMDADNVACLPVLTRSIGQFEEDVQELLSELGIVEKTAPVLAQMTEVCKAGAAMAGHRLTRLKHAITTLQQILDECTPETIDRPGVSAADVLSMPGIMKGEAAMALVRKNAESDKEHCDNCEDEDCEHPAHERMQKTMQGQLEALTKRAEKAEAQVTALSADLVKSQSDLATLREEMAVAKMSPEEQRVKMLESMPDLVRKNYLDQEARLELLEKSNRDLQEGNQRLAYIQKTAGLRHFGLTPDSWRVLKAIDLIPDEADRTELLRLITSANELMKTSAAWGARGSDGHGAGLSASATGDAEGQILALAKARAEEKGETLSKAIEHIARSQPELWEQNQREKRAKNRVNT